MGMELLCLETNDSRAIHNSCVQSDLNIRDSDRTVEVIYGPISESGYQPCHAATARVTVPNPSWTAWMRPRTANITQLCVFTLAINTRSIFIFVFEQHDKRCHFQIAINKARFKKLLVGQKYLAFYDTEKPLLRSQQPPVDFLMTWLDPVRNLTRMSLISILILSSYLFFVLPSDLGSFKPKYETLCTYHLPHSCYMY
jgi:hypothetical protein